MNVAAKKIEKSADKPADESKLKAYDHRRVFIPDLQKVGLWLLPRLRETYPEYGDQEFLTWLRGCAMSDTFLFVQTDHAVALAQTQRDALCRKPTAKEVFVLCDGHAGDEDEGSYLYTVMARWAREIGADEMWIEECTDVPREMIRARLGKLYSRDTMFISIDE